MAAPRGPRGWELLKFDRWMALKRQALDGFRGNTAVQQ